MPQLCGRRPGRSSLSVWPVTGTLIINDGRDSTPSSTYQEAPVTPATSFETLCSLQDECYSFHLTAKELGLEMLTDLCYSPELRNGGTKFKSRAVWPQHTIQVLRCVLRHCTHGKGLSRGCFGRRRSPSGSKRAGTGEGSQEGFPKVVTPEAGFAT